MAIFDLFTDELREGKVSKSNRGRKGLEVKREVWYEGK